MLMHTKGILVMTPDSAMVLTGKQSLDFSGGVSAEDNFGIGGYDRVMGPNGQAQYWAPDLAGARDVLMAHYDHTYVHPGEPGPRRATTTDPVDRDVTAYPHDAARLGLHDGRRHLLRGDQPRPQEGVRHPHPDGAPWPTRTTRPSSAGRAWPTPRPPWSRTPTSAASRCACSASSPRPSRGAGSRPPTARTPTPRARCSRGRRRRPPGPSTRPAATGPLVVLANLSGFDGSPESMRSLQLEYGAEIGRAIVNFDGPDRLLRRLPLPRWRVRGVLQGAQPEHDRARRRGLVRLGHRWRAGGGGRVRPRRRRPHRGGPPGHATSRTALGEATGASAPRWPPSWPSCAPRCARRSSARSRRSSTACTASTARSSVGSVDAVISARGAAPADHRGHRGRAGTRPLTRRMSRAFRGMGRSMRPRGTTGRWL